VDVYEIRRRKLEQLVEERGTSLEGLARQAGVLANYLSQIRGGRPMGSRFARKLEAGMGKPKGWMDLPQVPDTEAAFHAAEIVQGMAVISEEDREAVLRHLRLLVRNSPKSPQNPFGDVPIPPPSPSRKGPTKQ
jgi:hypothetical protein